jgi:hypothetical protein
MWKLLPLVIACLFCARAHAQYLRGYIFLAPTFFNNAGNPSSTGFGILPSPPLGSRSSTSSDAYAAGGGVETRFGEHGRWGDHFGAGLDLAAILPAQGQVFSNTVASISPNAYYHLRNRYVSSDFFLNGGYSLLGRDFAANAVNFGAGWNYFFQENLGFTIEARAVWIPQYKFPNPPDSRYVEFRFGLTFRRPQ